jgi:hypothetical protein
MTVPRCARHSRRAAKGNRHLHRHGRTFVLLGIFAAVLSELASRGIAISFGLCPDDERPPAVGGRSLRQAPV